MRRRLTVNLPPMAAAALTEFAQKERRPQSAAAVQLIQSALKNDRTNSASTRESDLKTEAHFSVLREELNALREHVDAQFSAQDAALERRLMNLVKLIQR